MPASKIRVAYFCAGGSTRVNRRARHHASPLLRQNRPRSGKSVEKDSNGEPHRIVAHAGGSLRVSALDDVLCDTYIQRCLLPALRLFRAPRSSP